MFCTLLPKDFQEIFGFSAPPIFCIFFTMFFKRFCGSSVSPYFCTLLLKTESFSRDFNSFRKFFNQTLYLWALNFPQIHVCLFSRKLLKRFLARVPTKFV
uniref:Uncharacterized protein n=1 Tax=Cacopsylla melanoneura TaxID=428564 RepID=A0A8D8TYQ3_9HEMI